jgi:polysaccharide biosynthesis protein PslG
VFNRSLRIILLLTIILACVAWPQPNAAQHGVPETYPPYQARYFSETSHSAVNYFLERWKNTPNALFVLGYPISQPFVEESFTNPGEFYRVQYFQRAVLEEHPENFGNDDNTYYVLGRLMGDLMAQGRENEEPFRPIENPGDGTWMEETRHTLKNSPAPFRSFFVNNGGLEVFGYPISEQFEEVNQADGKTYWVQYFQRQRMEWHPENADPQYQVLLGLLGQEYYESNHQDNPAFAPVPADYALPAPFAYGYNAMLYHDVAEWQDRERVLNISKDSGIYWIRQQIAWRDIQDASREIYWNELDDIVEDVHNAGMKLLLSVVQSPSWATANGSHGLPSREHFSTFADFMGQMAARYRGRVQAYEIWNEQNRACENGGDCSTAGGVGGRVASADYYVDMLHEAYNAIKANDPYALVVSGGPTSTETNHPDIAMSDITFVKGMLRNPKFRADVVGVHPGGHGNPPDTFWPDNPSSADGWTNSREFYFRRVEDIRQAMVDVGKGDMQIWITEFGWATANDTPGYGYGNNISFETQAEWIVRAFQKGRHEYAPWLGGMFLWQLNFAIPWKAHGNEMHEQASFGVLNGDWSPRPAWYAIRDMPKD